jgi:hypothetical protein
MPLVKDDRVERITARLYADTLQDFVSPLILERQPVDEDLRVRLEREWDVAVAHGVNATGVGSERNTERVALSPGVRGTVVATSGLVKGRDIPVLAQAVPLIELGQPPIDLLSDLR